MHIGVNVRIIWLTLFELFGSLRRSDDEYLAGGMHDIGIDGVELVDVHDAGDLGHESFYEAEVAAGDPDDRGDGLDVILIARVEEQPEFVPVVRQHDQQV
jgi:hypothetical protein